MSATHDLLTNHQHIIKELRLITGASGIFDVEVDGTLIFSKGTAGRHAEEGEVLKLFREHVGVADG